MRTAVQRIAVFGEQGFLENSGIYTNQLVQGGTLRREPCEQLIKNGNFWRTEAVSAHLNQRRSEVCDQLLKDSTLECFWYLNLYEKML
jgi:hypothetical protein